MIHEAMIHEANASYIGLDIEEARKWHIHQTITV